MKFANIVYVDELLVCSMYNLPTLGIKTKQAIRFIEMEVVGIRRKQLVTFVEGFCDLRLHRPLDCIIYLPLNKLHFGPPQCFFYRESISIINLITVEISLRRIHVY